MEQADRLPDTYIPDFHDKDAVLQMPVNPLGQTSLHVSKISFGASSLGNVFRSTNQKESLEVVREALQKGINYIDVAPWYGHGLAEEVLGKALEGIPRSAFYIATKVGRYKPEVEKMFDFSAEQTLRSVDESLQRMGLDYVDIIQVHDMEFAPNLDIIINETLPALQKVKQSGKARFIGITGYPLENFRTVIERSTVKIDTILTYCRACVHDNSLQEYIPFFQDHDCDISRLAMAHTLGFPGVDTTLFSTASLENLRKNMAAINSPLSTEEEGVLKNAIKTFMDPLTCHHWEGVEVDEYKRQLKGINTNDTFKLG